MFIKVSELKKEMFMASDKKLSEFSPSFHLHAVRSACRCCNWPSMILPATSAWTLAISEVSAA